MTNAEILFLAGQELAEQGIIRYTGRTYKAVLPNGEETTIKETEPLHTFAHWKSLGYSVKKGEKAVAKIRIWKHSAPKTETIPQTDGKEAQYVDKGQMFMKTAAFFTAAQVEKKATA